MKPILIHTLDLEASGPNLGTIHSILAVGGSATLVQKGYTTKIMGRFQANLSWPHPIQWNAETYTWYTTNHLSALESLCVDQVTPEVAACELTHHINAMQQLAAHNKWDYRIVVDNEFFDIPWIDWFLLSFCPFAQPLRQSRVDGHYMGATEIIDVNQRLQAMRDLGLNTRLKEFVPAVRADHTPLRDSLYIAEKYIHYLKVTDVHRKKAAPRKEAK
jgi:hypothetical protein